jgi:hypothetical protein
MAIRDRITRLAQRIEALGRGRDEGPRLGVIWGKPNETVAEARERHSRLYPGDDVQSMMVIGWEPMSAEEWERTYCR